MSCKAFTDTNKLTIVIGEKQALNFNQSKLVFANFVMLDKLCKFIWTCLFITWNNNNFAGSLRIKGDDAT